MGPTWIGSIKDDIKNPNMSAYSAEKLFAQVCNLQWMYFPYTNMDGSVWKLKTQGISRQSSPYLPMEVVSKKCNYPSHPLIQGTFCVASEHRIKPNEITLLIFTVLLGELMEYT